MLFIKKIVQIFKNNSSRVNKTLLAKVIEKLSVRYEQT